MALQLPQQEMRALPATDLGAAMERLGRCGETPAAKPRPDQAVSSEQSTARQPAAQQPAAPSPTPDAALQAQRAAIVNILRQRAAGPGEQRPSEQRPEQRQVAQPPAAAEPQRETKQNEAPRTSSQAVPQPSAPPRPEVSPESDASEAGRPATRPGIREPAVGDRTSISLPERDDAPICGVFASPPVQASTVSL